jgi:hypothetical protein
MLAHSGLAGVKANQTLAASVKLLRRAKTPPSSFAKLRLAYLQI